MDFRVFVEPQQGATYADQLAVAKAAEALGYSAFFRSDHYVAMSGDGLPGPTDSWVTLAGIARETTSIRLGTMVTSATFRYPGPLAISVAQVDEMSGGRVELGLGAGWFEAEHKAYAIPFPPLGERFERLREQLDIITGLWTTPVGETFDYTGKHYSRRRTRPRCPSPSRRPHPPIIIGGGGRQAHARAGREVRRRVQHAVHAAGRSLKTQYDRVRPRARRRRPRAGFADVFGGVRGVRRTRRARDGRRAAAIGREVDELRSNSPLVGTPERDRRQARPVRRDRRAAGLPAGSGHVRSRPPGPVRHRGDTSTRLTRRYRRSGV